MLNTLPQWCGQFVRFIREEVDLYNLGTSERRSGLLRFFVLFEEEHEKTSVWEIFPSWESDF